MSGPYDGREVAERIVKFARASNDGLVTYTQIWESYHSGRGRDNFLEEVMEILDAAIHYCATVPAGPLPVVTTIVVGIKTRKITQTAKENIFKGAKDAGFNTGPDVEAFYQAQLDGTLRLIAWGHP